MPHTVPKLYVYMDQMDKGLKWLYIGLSTAALYSPPEYDSSEHSNNLWREREIKKKERECTQSHVHTAPIHYLLVITGSLALCVFMELCMPILPPCGQECLKSAFPVMGAYLCILPLCAGTMLMRPQRHAECSHAHNPCVLTEHMEGVMLRAT